MCFEIEIFLPLLMSNLDEMTEIEPRACKLSFLALSVSLNISFNNLMKGERILWIILVLGIWKLEQLKSYINILIIKRINFSLQTISKYCFRMYN